MNKKAVQKLYHLGTKIAFQSISKNIAKKLVEFATTNKVGEIIKINNVEYKLRYISIKGRSVGTSIYYLSRNRLIRISDHWSAIQRGFSPVKSEILALKGVGKIAENWWTLVGDDQSFVPNVVFKTTYTWWDYNDPIKCSVVIKNHKFEGGFVPLRQIDFDNEHAKKGRVRNHKIYKK